MQAKENNELPADLTTFEVRSSLSRHRSSFVRPATLRWPPCDGILWILLDVPTNQAARANLAQGSWPVRLFRVMAASAAYPSWRVVDRMNPWCSPLLGHCGPNLQLRGVSRCSTLSLWRGQVPQTPCVVRAHIRAPLDPPRTSAVGEDAAAVGRVRGLDQGAVHGVRQGQCEARPQGLRSHRGGGWQVRAGCEFPRPFLFHPMDRYIDGDKIQSRG